MDDIRLGARVRVVRHRLGWRQSDVAARARVSQDTVSRIERGQLSALQLRTVRDVLRVLEMELRLDAWWRGGDLDRLADEGHATLAARIVALLEARGWAVRPEVSFAVYGERGSIDVLAWHPERRILIVIEVKTSLNSIEETIRRHDVKLRLARGIAAERFGWEPRAIAAMLVLPGTTAARDRVSRLDGILRHRYPLRGHAARGWLADPGRPGGGLLVFVRPTLPGRRTGVALARKRIRRPTQRPNDPQHAGRA
jgi:transcriptional regulator with XRE-family HTH domain